VTIHTILPKFSTFSALFLRSCFVVYLAWHWSDAASDAILYNTLMDRLLDSIKTQVRRIFRVIARGLNAVTFGKLHPNVITIFGLAMHLPIAYFIAVDRLMLAAILLVVFGSFDTLDGELARLQKRASHSGMLLDSITDRMKEVLLYGGVVFYLLQNGYDGYVVWAVFAIGGSILTSYVNAMGDVAMHKSGARDHKTNEGFRGGLLRFEVRMFLMVVALLTGRLEILVVIVAILAWFTAFQRLRNVIRRLG